MLIQYIPFYMIFLKEITPTKIVII